jgi:hypothetical protein
MSIAKFIPTIWSARLLAHLDKTHVLTKLVNRDYEGEITQYGDKVKITSIGDITIRDYVANTDMVSPEELTTDDQLLEIDQQKYFNFQIDDVDAAQVRASLADQAMQRAAYGLADVTDRWLAELMAESAAESCLIGTDDAPIAITEDTAYNYLVRMKVMLDKANVPTEGRWVLVPPEYHGLLLQDKRFVATGGTQAEQALGYGYIGRAAGFNIYSSNNLPNTLGVYKVIASYNGSTSYAEQIVKTEAYRMEKRFADGIKGLHVYGAKVTRPDKIVVLTASFDSGILEPLTLTSTAGTSTGKTKIAVSMAVPTGYTAKYKTGATVALPQYDDVLTTGWTSFTAGADISATTGHDIVVAYVDSNNKAKAAGKTTVVAATE